VRHRQPHLVEQPSPTQGIGSFIAFDLPVTGHLLVKRQRRGTHPLRLTTFHMMAIHQRLNTAITHILVAETAQQIVQQPFTQGPLDTSI